MEITIGYCYRQAIPFVCFCRFGDNRNAIKQNVLRGSAVLTTYMRIVLFLSGEKAASKFWIGNTSTN